MHEFFFMGFQSNWNKLRKISFVHILYLDIVQQFHIFAGPEIQPSQRIFTKGHASIVFNGKSLYYQELLNKINSSELYCISCVTYYF